MKSFPFLQLERMEPPLDYEHVVVVLINYLKMPTPSSIVISVKAGIQFSRALLGSQPSRG